MMGICRQLIQRYQAEGSSHDFGYNHQETQENQFHPRGKAGWKTTVLGSSCDQERKFIVQLQNLQGAYKYPASHPLQIESLLPLGENRKTKKLEYIFETAWINGYRSSRIKLYWTDQESNSARLCILAHQLTVPNGAQVFTMNSSFSISDILITKIVV